jgi:hypothetical protein
VNVERQRDDSYNRRDNTDSAEERSLTTNRAANEQDEENNRQDKWE